MSERKAEPGKPLPSELLVDVSELVTAYFAECPDPSVPAERVAFGTSGHRGSALRRSFNEAHIAAISQAICDYRKSKGSAGPLFLGRDPHALSHPAFVTALEVLTANDVEVMIDRDDGYTPTPVISHAVLRFNRNRKERLAEGIVITPSHNPPEDGGFKYNEPHGGPADTSATRWIEHRANELLASRLQGVRRQPWDRARNANSLHRYDYLGEYVRTLHEVVDLSAVSRSGLKIGVDPLGGAAVAYWPRIAEEYRLDLEVVNETVDSTFRFMPADWDGRIRMDCSSPFAMRSLVDLRHRFDVAFGNDTDADRHGVVTRASGLLNPNHYLTVAVWYLLERRENWPRAGQVGKTVVTTQLLDRVVGARGRKLFEVPVGFKWFVNGLVSGELLFAGEESAGASLLCRDGSVWTTDKDGIVLGLLAAEIHAALGADPGRVYTELTNEFGNPVYERIDAPASRKQKAALARLSPADVHITDLAGVPVTAVLDKAPGNGAPIGGIKVVGSEAWFAARPSGTEEVYKLYAESFLGQEHLRQVQAVARDFLSRILSA